MARASTRSAQTLSDVTVRQPIVIQGSSSSGRVPTASTLTER